MPTFVKTSVKVSLSSEHLQEDIQVSIQCQESFMTHIDRCEIFIATFTATFIAPFDENRLKPNRDQGCRLSRHLLISRFAMKTVKVSPDL